MPRAKGMPSKGVDEHLKRRVRMRAKTKEQVQKESKYDVESLAAQAASARVAFQKAEAELQLAEQKLFEGMTATKTWEAHPEFVYDDHRTEALFNVETPLGRSSTVIDPEKYFALIDKNLISHEDFFNSVSVSITKARDFLGEKQIEKIGEVTPAKKKDPVLKTQYVLVDGTPIFGKLPKN
jgi:hypothetical protein